MQGMNKVFLLGNLGADPELYTTGSSPVLKFRVAINETWYDKKKEEQQKKVEWVSCVCFGPMAEALAKILAKGSGVSIEGSLQTTSYEKDGTKIWRTDVVARNVILVGARKERADDSDDGFDTEEYEKEPPAAAKTSGSNTKPNGSNKPSTTGKGSKSQEARR